MREDLDLLMKQNDISALWVSGSLKHNPDMVYFTGIHNVAGADLIKKVGRPPILYITSQMEREEGEKSGLETYMLDEKYPLTKYLEVAKGDIAQAYAKRLRDVLIDSGLSNARIAIFGKNPINQMKSILDHLSVLMPDSKFIGFFKDSPIEQARMTKDAEEIQHIRKMGKITTKVVERTKNFLTSQKVLDGYLVDEEGQPLRIKDVKKRIQLWLAELGADNPKETIFAIGRDAGIPHSAGNPEDQIELGKSIVFDIFPCETGGGYFYDFTRTWCLGFASQEIIDVHRQVLSVHHQLIDELEADSPYSIYQKKTCALFKEMGHQTIEDSFTTKEGYVHSIGHGLGLDVHENPFSGITSTKGDTLSEGVVFTIEPGLYYPSKGFGVRIEDTIVLNNNGQFKILADYPYDLVLPMKVH